MAHHLQDQESKFFAVQDVLFHYLQLCLNLVLVAAHYGHNRERNRIVRGDVSQARSEQEDELKQALALQQFQQELRLQQ